MKSSLKYLSLWLPFVYSMAISGIALHGYSQSPISLPPGFPAYFAFFPMTFLFLALSMQNHISGLEKRIASLEKQSGPKTNEILK